MVTLIKYKPGHLTKQNRQLSEKFFTWWGGGGGGAFPILSYTRRFHPNGEPVLQNAVCKN